MNNTCKQCGADSGIKLYCCDRCKWTWHNRNRTLTPNVDFCCEVCGTRVRKWVSPAKIASGEAVNRFCGRTCAGAWRTGKNHPQWRGGRFKDKDGYWLVHMPGHRQSDAKGYIREHRLVMERKIGRPLRRREVVHHINDNPSDNRPDNLRLYPSNAKHKADDYKKRRIDYKGRLLKK